MFAIYPREVYLIFPYDEFGNVAGVYVGSSSWVEERIRRHLYDFNNEFINQRELHELMRKNGFALAVVDNIENYKESYTEYDWVDYFRNFYDMRIFNSAKRGKAICNWQRIENPLDKLFSTDFEGKQAVFFGLLVHKRHTS